MGPRLRGPLAVLWLLAASGCQRPPPEAERPGQASEAVRRFFAALPAGDCAELGRMLAAREASPGCRETVDELNHRNLRLLEVLEAKVDGRDARAVIVKARISERGVPRESPLLVRVEWHPDGWKLRL